MIRRPPQNAHFHSQMYLLHYQCPSQILGLVLRSLAALSSSPDNPPDDQEPRVARHLFVLFQPGCIHMAMSGSFQLVAAVMRAHFTKLKLRP